MFKRHHHVYQAPDDSGSTGAEAADAGAASEGADASVQAGAEAGGAAAAAGSVNFLKDSLGADAGQAGEGEAGAAAAAIDTAAKVAEQFHVKRSDGSLDVEATLAKQADSYNALAQRMRETGAPPKDAAEYKVTIPENLAGAWDPDADESVADFRKEALEMGLSQKQFDRVVSNYLKRIPGMIAQTQAQQAEACRTELSQVWRTPKEVQANTRAAARAVTETMGADAARVMDELGNNPLFLRFAAAVGAEMAEDKSPGQGGNDGNAQFNGMSRDQLLAHPAYSDPKHVDHARISAIVRRSYEKEFGTEAALG